MPATVKLDPQFWYDQALERVFDAANEFEVLDLPVEFIDDFTRVRKQYRKISLAVHPDKNRHPQADAAFRKVYGAFETLSDLGLQRKLLISLGLGSADPFGFEPTEAEKAAEKKQRRDYEDKMKDAFRSSKINGAMQIVSKVRAEVFNADADLQSIAESQSLRKAGLTQGYAAIFENHRMLLGQELAKLEQAIIKKD